MFSQFKNSYYKAGAAITVGLMFGATDAHAQTAGSTFNDIAENVSTSIANVPGLVSGLAYLIGLILGVLGILKIKDHVENPSQTELKDGVIRLVVGGALFALPILFDAMLTTINGDFGTNSTTNAARLNGIDFNSNVN